MTLDPSKGLIAAVLFSILATATAGAEKADLTLNTGRVLKGARIVSIGADQVMVVFSAGAEAVPIGDVPLDLLARAQMEFDANAPAQKARTEEIARRAAETKSVETQKKTDEIKVRLAEAAARERSVASEASAEHPEMTRRIAQLQGSGTEAALTALKARFPVASKRKTQVTITNPKPDPRKKASNNYHPTRIDTIEVDVPSVDILDRYRPVVLTATLASLPKVLEKLEAQLGRDLTALRAQGISQENQSANAQVKLSYEWLNGPLRNYLTELKAIVVSP